MDPRNLYTLFYRQGEKGATTGLIEASNQRVAEALGQHFCNQQMGRKYIRVVPTLLATEDDLPEGALAELTAPPAPRKPLETERADDPNSSPYTPKPPQNKGKAA